MRLITIFAFLVLMFGWSPAHAHPLHLSITNITYENGKLMISMKTFRDDWEVAYFHYHSKPIDFNDPAQRGIAWFEEYLNKHFKISLNEGDLGFILQTDNVIINDKAMFIEMQCTVPSKPKSLYIYNALLTDIYPDQTNLVIFGFKKKETGIKFDVKKDNAELLLK